MKNVTIKKLSLEFKDDYLDFYEKAGFAQIIEQNGVAVMRKLL